MRARGAGFSAALGLILVLTALSGRDARAAATWTIEDRSQHERPLNLDFGITSGWFFAGTYILTGIPIVPDGFIPGLNDSFDIEAGGYLGYNYGCGVGFAGVGLGCGAFRVSPQVGVRWKFHLTSEWTVYAVSRLGFRMNFGPAYGDLGTFSVFGFDGYGGVGAYWMFSENLWMRFDTGTYGASIGLGLPL